jgi:hypothetical protein
MHHSLRLPTGRWRQPLCGALVPHHGQVIVLVFILLLTVAVCIAAPTAAVAASTAALVQAGAALWMALRRPSAATAEG